MMNEGQRRSRAGRHKGTRLSGLATFDPRPPGALANPTRAPRLVPACLVTPILRSTFGWASTTRIDQPVL